MGIATKLFTAIRPFRGIVLDRLERPWPIIQHDEIEPISVIRGLSATADGSHALGIPRCASCGCRENLWFREDPRNDVVCRGCCSPFTALDFPEYYCDLGGEA